MAFNNATLIPGGAGGANRIDLLANGVSGEIFTGTDAADAFVVADGNIGDDTIENFASNDSIITGRQIFDNNRDGYIAFATGARLDVDRVRTGNSEADQGQDNITVLGTGSERVTEIRYLGTKDGGFVYADSSTRDNLLGRFSIAGQGLTTFQDATTTGADSSITQTLKIDNDVGTSAFDFGATSAALLTDNALGLNFGNDVINDFGDDDLLVFTSQLFDRSGNDIVTFGTNLVLDLSGAGGPRSSDPNNGPGGTLDLNDPDQTQVYYLGEKTIGETTYYYYGTENAATPDGVGFPA